MSEIIVQDFGGKHNGDLPATSARLMKGVTKSLVQTAVLCLTFWMRETWKSIHGWTGYEVSSKGRIRSFWKIIGEKGRRGGFWILAPVARIISLKVHETGRKRVVLHKDWKRKTFSVSTLVLETFVGPRPKGMFGCHGPAGLSDDSIKNVYWAKPSQNNGEDRRRDKTLLFGEIHPRARLTESDVRTVLKERANGKTRHAIAEQFSVSPGTIGGIIYNKTWRHVAR